MPLHRMLGVVVCAALVGGCGKPRTCQIYDACCASLTADPAMAERFRKEVRCYDHAAQRDGEICAIELERAIREARDAGVRPPATCGD